MAFDDNDPGHVAGLKVQALARSRGMSFEDGLACYKEAYELATGVNFDDAYRTYLSGGTKSRASAPASRGYQSAFSGAFQADPNTGADAKVRAIHEAICDDADRARAERERQEAVNLAEHRQYVAARRQVVAQRKIEDDEAELMADAFREAGITVR